MKNDQITVQYTIHCAKCMALESAPDSKSNLIKEIKSKKWKNINNSWFCHQCWNPKEASMDFLVRTGIYDKSGKLTKEYGG